MTADAAFLAALAAEPECETNRLVYADWLDECGDPRGAVLRLESRLFALPETSAEVGEVRRELGRLAAAVDVRWWAAVARVHVETGPAFASPYRLGLNAPGPFYTCGDCMACDAPEAEAPDLLAPLAHGPGGNFTTYFLRQPETPAEIERACWAISVCCAADLRYGGTDPRIIARLGNTAAACDLLVAGDSPTLVPAGHTQWPDPPPRRPWWRFWRTARPAPATPTAG